MSEFMELKIDKFTFKVAVDRTYTPQGVWAQVVDGVVRVGLSDFLQQRSGDIAFADVQPGGTRLKTGEDFAEIETIKVTVDLNSPAAGKIAAVNPLMESTPEIINQDPYGTGWVCEIAADDWDADCKTLLDAAAYFAQMKQEAENEVKANG